MYMYNIHVCTCTVVRYANTVPINKKNNKIFKIFLMNKKNVNLIFVSLILCTLIQSKTGYFIHNYLCCVQFIVFHLYFLEHCTHWMGLNRLRTPNDC